MKSKFLYVLPFIIIFVCFLVIRFLDQYSSYAVILFALNGLFSFIFGIISIKKKHFIIGIILTIIGVLSLVMYLMIQATTAKREQAYEASLLETLSHIPEQAKVLYDHSSSHSYESLCNNDSLVKNSMAVGTKCFSDADSYVVTTRLKINNKRALCVDTTGMVSTFSSARYDQIIDSNTLCSE